MAFVLKDNFLPVGLLDKAREAWPSPDWKRWHHYAGGKQASRSLAGFFEQGKPTPDGLAGEHAAGLPSVLQCVLAKMSALAVDRLTGCNPAFADLEFLHGAGLHQMSDRSALGLHLDTGRHPTLPWRREATAILYLDACNGGELDLIAQDRQAIESCIAPVPNRLLVFSTPGQYHRVNECRSIRRSICLFFWSICDDSVGGNRQASFV